MKVFIINKKKQTNKNLSTHLCSDSVPLEGSWPPGSATASQSDSGQDFDLTAPKS